MTSKYKEDALDAVLSGGSGGASSSGVSPGFRTARAIRYLQDELRDQPETIYEYVEGKMQESATNDSKLLPRAWMENRSRMGSHPGTINWTWVIAGIHQALIQQRPKEARARCALGLAAGEQVALDQGSWMLAWQLLREPVEPPVETISQRKVQTTTTTGTSLRPHTALADPRWVDVGMALIRDTDSFLESRQRLGRRVKQDQPKGKGKGKDKDAQQP